jgi:hypothetical protein
MRSASCVGLVYTFRKTPFAATGSALQPSGRGFSSITMIIGQLVATHV